MLDSAGLKMMSHLETFRMGVRIRRFFEREYSMNKYLCIYLFIRTYFHISKFKANVLPI